MINSLFDIDGSDHHLLIDYCRDILRQPKYSGFLRMYKNFNKDFIKKMKDEYYLHLQTIRKVIPFPEWFIKKHYGQYHFDFLEQHGYSNDNINSVCVLTDFECEWKLIGGKTLTSVYPPSNFTLEYGQNSQGNEYTIEASAFKLPVGNFESIIKQNNWTNVNVQIIGKQLSRVEENIVSVQNKIDKMTPIFKKEEVIEKSKEVKKLEPVCVKPPIKVDNINYRNEKEYN